MAAILIIDDDVSVRDALVVILSSNRYDALVASDGPTGLRLFRQVRFDAVVVDIFMPEMDGLATIRAMRLQSPQIPIIAMSGHSVTNGSHPDFLKMAVKLGATQALQKPFTADELFAALALCLDGGDHCLPGKDLTRPEFAVEADLLRRAV
ncbi:MAG: response regulator [Ancalomicrobiaceae bacterium]|nr:response regulator [Ancalomicrobiaceae bacterium]